MTSKQDAELEQIAADVTRLELADAYTREAYNALVARAQAAELPLSNVLFIHRAADRAGLISLADVIPSRGDVRVWDSATRTMRPAVPPVPTP